MPHTLSLDRSIFRSLDRSLWHSVARSIARSLGRAIARSLGRSAAHSVVRSHGRSLCRSLDRSIARSLRRSQSEQRPKRQVQHQRLAELKPKVARVEVSNLPPPAPFRTVVEFGKVRWFIRALRKSGLSSPPPRPLTRQT